MPSWGLHIYIAECVCDKLKNKIDYNSFLFGNVLPDIYSGWIIKDASQVYNYDVSHYASKVILNGREYKLSSYEKFIKEQRENLKNPIILGYLSHLMADHFFNKYAFSHHYIKDSSGQVEKIVLKNGEIIQGNSETARIYKQNDTAIFSNYILKTKCKINSINLNSDITRDVKYIKNMNIKAEDLVKVDNYLNNMLGKKYEDILQLGNNYMMFTEEELYLLIQDIINNIVDMINKINN